MNWPYKPLSELCLLAVDCVNKTAPVVEGPTPYKMIRTTNVKGGFIDTEAVRYVSEATFEQWTRRSRPRYGDVILTREAPVGEVGRCTFDESELIFLGQRLFQYRPDPHLLDWNYLAFALQSRHVQSTIHGRSFGATIPHLKVGDAEHLEVPCPPLETQRSIGELLAAYDDLVENNHRRIALLEESVLLLYGTWFGRFRFPGNAQQGCVPQDWQPTPLSDLIHINPTTSFEKGRSYPFVPMQSLSETSMLIGEREERVVQGGAKFQNLDTLLARITPCLENGKTGFVQFLNESAPVASGSTEFIVLRSHLVSPYWLYCLAREESFRLHVIGSMVGSDGRQRVNTKCFDSYVVAKPSRAVLDAFDSIVQPLFHQVEALARMNQRLRTCREELLDRLISGALRV